MKNRPPSLAQAAKNAAREKAPLHLGGAPPLARYLPDRKSQAAGEPPEPPELVVTHIKYQPGGKPARTKHESVQAARVVRAPQVEPPAEDVLVDHVGPLARLRDAAKIMAAAASKEAWGEWRAVRVRRVADQVELAAGDGRGLFVVVKAGDQPTALKMQPGADVFVPAAKLWSILDAADGVEAWELKANPTGRPDAPWTATLKGEIAKRLYFEYELGVVGEGLSWPADGRDNGFLAASVPGREFRAALRRGGWLHDADRRVEDPVRKPLPLLEGEEPEEYSYGLVRLTIEPAGRKRKGDWLHVEGAAAECHVSASAAATLYGKAPVRSSVVFAPKHLRSLAAWLSDASDVVVELGPASATFSQAHIEITLPFAKGRFPPIEDRPGPARNPLKVSLRVEELRNRVELACLGLSDLRRDMGIQFTADMVAFTAPAGGKTRVSLMLGQDAFPGGGWAQTTVDGRRLLEALAKLDKLDCVQLGVAGPTDPLSLATDDGAWKFFLLGSARITTV